MCLKLSRADHKPVFRLEIAIKALKPVLKVS